MKMKTCTVPIIMQGFPKFNDEGVANAKANGLNMKLSFELVTSADAFLAGASPPSFCIPRILLSIMTEHLTRLTLHRSR